MNEVLKGLFEALTTNPPLLVVSLILAVLILPFATIAAKRVDAVFETYVAREGTALPTQRIANYIIILHALIAFLSSIWCYAATDIPAYGFEKVQAPFPRFLGWLFYATAGILPIVPAGLTHLAPAWERKMRMSTLVSVIAAWIYSGFAVAGGSLPLSFPHTSFPGWNLQNIMALPGQAAILVPSILLVTLAGYGMHTFIWGFAGELEKQAPPNIGQK